MALGSKFGVLCALVVSVMSFSAGVNGEKFVSIRSHLGPGSTVKVSCDHDPFVETLADNQEWFWEFHDGLHTNKYFCNFQYGTQYVKHIAVWDHNGQDPFTSNCQQCAWWITPSGLSSWNKADEAWESAYLWANSAAATTAQRPAQEQEDAIWTVENYPQPGPNPSSGGHSGLARRMSEARGEMNSPYSCF